MAAGSTKPQVVGFEIDDHPSLSTHLEKALQTQVARETEALVSAKDWPDFEKRRGSINGLNLAISLCQQSSKLLQG